MKNTRIFLLVIIVAIVAASVYLFWNRNIAKQRDEQATAGELKQIRGRVAEMASRWNAVTNWQDVFKGRYPSPVYTAEMEKAVLIKQPILVYASVDDVKPAVNGYVAEFSSPVTQLTVKTKYSLSCDAALAQKFMAERRGSFEFFAVVVHADHVEKQVATHADSAEESFDRSYFLVQGTARDAVFVGVRGLGLAGTGGGAAK